MYKVKLDIFEGPLDLLLHLIEKMEIDIHEISILTLTESYLEYIKSIDEISLPNAEEYIVMASTLMHIKSKSLLPKDDDFDSVDNYEEELVKQLIEYKNYKDICRKFELLYFDRSMFGEKTQEDIMINGKLMNMSIENLQRSFKYILTKYKNNDELSINYRKEVSLENIKNNILKYLKRNNKVNFEDLITIYDTKEEIVAIFLALLDMVSKNIINCENKNDDIVIELIG